MTLKLYSANCPGDIGFTYWVRCGCCSNHTDVPHEYTKKDVEKVIRAGGWRFMSKDLGWICPDCICKHEKQLTTKS